LQFSLIFLDALLNLIRSRPYIEDFVLSLSDFNVESFDFADELFLHLRVFGLLEEAQDLMIVPIDESSLVGVYDCDVGLESFDDISQKPIILDDILFQFTVDCLQAHLIVEFRLSLHLHDSPDGVDQLVLKFTGCFDVFDLLEQQNTLHDGTGYYTI
jgi:hypothetical protein